MSSVRPAPSRTHPATPASISCRAVTLRASMHAWLTLLRAPNLLTVPGAPLAGFILAGGDGKAVTPTAAVLLLYISGLALNDWADRHVDARERPERPLPSGRIRPGTALAVGMLGLLAGTGLAVHAGPAVGGASAALAAAVLIYTFFVKAVPGLGALTMGVCRALSLVVGGAAGGAPYAPQVLWAATTLGVYVAAVTILARVETRSLSRRSLAALPGILLASAWIAGLAFTRTPVRTFLAAGLPAVLAAAWPALRLPRPVPPAAIQNAVGHWIRSLILVQAAFMIASPHPHPAAAIVLILTAYPLSAMLGKRFAGS